jgi:alanine-alpha-ketoisovalerate/valine-pyruvate aminotransferase
MLGIDLNPEYIEAVKKSVEGQLLAKKKEKIEKQEELEGVYGVDYDDRFSFIVGRTKGGATYGVPWETCCTDTFSS